MTFDSAINEVKDFLLSKPNLADAIGKGLRQSFDEVIDGPRTGRFRIEQLEKTEKTYIGTKVEIVLRASLELTRGNVLDNSICEQEVDTKFSITGGWMIPKEAIGHVCLLVQANDNNARFSVGLLRMTSDVLTNGANQDGKKSVSAYGRTKISWLLENYPMPRNFLLELPSDIREKIMSQSSGMQRIKTLFQNVTGQIIPRIVIEQVAQQKDPLRRARQMKKKLAADGFKVLCANYEIDRSEFIRHGFTDFSTNDWLCIKQEVDLSNS